MDLFDLLNNIRQRQAEIPQTSQEELFATFQLWVEHQLCDFSYRHWDQIILDISETEEAAMEHFFDLFDGFVAHHETQTLLQKTHARETIKA